MRARILFLTLSAWLCLLGSAYGALSLEVLSTREFSSRPLAMEVSEDGSRLFVLTPDAKLHVVRQDNTLEGSIQLEAGVEDIQLLPGPDRLALLNPTRQTIQFVELRATASFDESGSPVLGPENAPVTLIVFDDFECPYCARLVPALKELRRLYPDDVRIVFKNFPLRSHSHARDASLAAMAAHRQGAFWPYHDLLFENFRTLNEEAFVRFAEELELDMEAFNRDRSSATLKEKVDADILEGNQGGVRGTPTLFLNGRKIPNRGLDFFQQEIDRALEKRTDP